MQQMKLNFHKYSENKTFCINLKWKRAFTTCHLLRAEDHQEQHRHQASHSSRCFFTLIEIMTDRSSRVWRSQSWCVQNNVWTPSYIHSQRHIPHKDIHANPFLSINIIERDLILFLLAAHVRKWNVLFFQIHWKCASGKQHTASFFSVIKGTWSKNFFN